jgi:uncharacterized protein (TIGR03435 family)
MRHLLIKVVLVVAATAIAVMAAQAPKPSFEVASIKPTKFDGMLSMPPVMMDSRFVATNVTLKDLVFFAYSPQSRPFLYAQIVGGPSWIDEDHFGIEEQLKGNPGPIAHDKLQDVARTLLEDRFQLKVHQGTEELPVLDLVVSETGLKMKMSEDQTPLGGDTPTTYDSSGQDAQPLRRGSMRVSTNLSGTIITGNAVTISRLAAVLQGQSGRIVFDKTGLKGVFDFTLGFMNQGLGSPANDTPRTNQSGTSLVAAIQELGLKLESAESPVEVLVIDSVHRPSEN